MTRGRGFSSSRSSYRGSSNRGGSSWGGRGGYGSSRGGGGHFSSSFSYDRKYPSERYSNSRGHSDDYRKSYRPDNSGYSGRDSSGHRSPDRKRMRTEALSSRHDSSYGLDSYNSSRYESSGYPPRRSFSDDRRSSFSHREEFRKPPSSSPRGGYRGRISSRGSRGSRLRDRPMRRRLVDSSYAIHRRVFSTQSADYARRLRIARLRSAAFRRAALKRDKSIDKEDSDEEEKEENWDEEIAENEAKENGEATEKNDTEEKGETSEKSTKKEDASDKEDKKSETDSVKARRKRFVKLHCIHCNTSCITFAKYNMHLSGSKHIAAMRRVAIRQKAILGQMRMAQRSSQRELEKTTDDLAPRTNFCPLCKLNYKQPKLTHQNAESHKNMKKFLMPYCKTCKITFKSPMLFENHLCSIDHMKRKSKLDATKSDKEDSGTEDVNLENFMTIDSVGDVDDEEVVEGKKEILEKKEKINIGIEQIRKVEVNYCDLCRMYLPRVEDSELPRVLSKHCKLRTHMQQYVRYKEDKELAKHAERLQRKENAEKENKEKKHKADTSTENVESTEENKETTQKSEEEKEKTVAEDEEAGDDKLWADVDKDLGDILAEAESGNKSSDEDEDSHANGERYDRFKTDEEKLKKAEEDEAEAKETAEAEKVEEEEEKVEEK